MLLRVPPSGGTLSLLWCSFVNVVNCGKGEGTHVLAQRAGKFFSAVRGTGKSVRKNRPLVPQSNIAGSWTRGGEGTLLSFHVVLSACCKEYLGFAVPNSYHKVGKSKPQSTAPPHPTPPDPIPCQGATVLSFHQSLQSLFSGTISGFCKCCQENAIRHRSLQFLYVYEIFPADPSRIEKERAAVCVLPM